MVRRIVLPFPISPLIDAPAACDRPRLRVERFQDPEEAAQVRVGSLRDDIEVARCVDINSPRLDGDGAHEYELDTMLREALQQSWYIG